MVVSAQSGIEMIASRMMDWAAKRRLCRLVIVNKIDAENVDLPNLLASIQSLFGKECLPINLPAGGGKRVVDCFFNPDGESDFSSVGQAHSALVDQVVEVDEELMALYLEQGEIAPEELHAPFEKALREGHLVPVCFVSAKTGAGVAELLDVLVKLAPNPAEGNPPLFYKGEGESASEFRSEPDPKKHVLAHVFKVVMDPFVGKLGVFRVHQGTVTKDTQLFVGDGRKPFKVGHLFMLQGGKNVEIERAVPGDIAAVAKVDEIEFDCVLHDSHDEDHIHMRPLEFPTPMQGVAITPKKRGDEQRISEVLHRMIAEDPTLVVEHDATTNETVLRALGDLHLRSVLERMASQFKLEVDTRPPRIPYRETITAQAEGFHRHKKQTGGAGQFGEVSLRVEPRERGAGFEFLDQTKGGVIPHQFMPAVQKGVEQVLGTGAIAGFPLQDVRVVVYDGKHHPVDSKEVAFVAAGKKAFLDAIEKARPIVLEPIVTRRGDLPRDEHRRHRRRPVVAARPGHRDARPAAGRARDQRARPARGARRLFGPAEVRDRRPRLVVDAAVALRAGAAAAAAAARRRAQEVAQAGRGIGEVAAFQPMTAVFRRPGTVVAPAASAPARGLAAAQAARAFAKSASAARRAAA